MNQDDQKAKDDPTKEAKASFILGALSVVIPLMNFFLLWLTLGMSLSNLADFPLEQKKTLITIVMFSSLPAIPFAVIGLILGVQGLKSTKRNLAIGGIVLSLIVLGVVLIRLVGSRSFCCQ